MARTHWAVHIGTIILLVAAGSSTVSAQSDRSRTIDFQQQIGPWLILGDHELGTCFATLRAPGGTSLAINAHPTKDEFDFILKNEAWKSLIDNADIRLEALFLNGANKVTDLWNLDSVSHSEASNGPSIVFSILRAKNDRADFVQGFQTASSIAFFKEGTSVIVARFDLPQSSAAIETLKQCRTRLQISDTFDPFAK